MSLATGQQALIRRVNSMTTSANIVLPNGPLGKGLPRYVVQVSGGSQRPLISRITDATAEIVVRVETKKGDYTTENDELVSDLVARFPPGERFDGVKIIDAPLPRPPLPVSDGVYAVPVIIRGRFSF